MSELILHIGLSKTGTTSLQKFLFDNRHALKAHGVDFPIFSNQPWRGPIANGNYIFNHCLSLAKGEAPYSNVHDASTNAQLLDESLSGATRTLLSEELIPSGPAVLLDGGYSPDCYWHLLADELCKGGLADLTIIAYLRRQDDWIASRWKQSARSGLVNLPLERYWRKPSIRLSMDYSGVLAGVENAFGDRARIVLRRYDRSAFEGGDIYRDFCSAAGIEWDDTYVLPEEDANPSLTFDVAEALRTFADQVPPYTPLRRRTLVPLALRLSDENPDLPRMAPFDESTPRSLMERFLEGNRRITDDYFGGEPLFSEEYGGRPVWKPDEKRIAEYRVAFEEAIRRDKPPVKNTSTLHALTGKLPERIKAPLRALRDRVVGR